MNKTNLLRNMYSGVILSFFIRVFTALSSLAAIKLTHLFLPPQEFRILNYILFVLAVSTSLSSPVNRLFWAENSRNNFSIAVYSTFFITFFLTVISLLSYYLINKIELYWFVVFFLVTIFYLFSKILERYIYGQILFEIGFNTALAVSGMFACVELFFVIGQYYFGLSTLDTRLFGPAALFFAVLVCVPVVRVYFLYLVNDISNFKKNISLSAKQIFSTKGAKMLTLTTITTTSIMVDRLVLGYFNIGDSAASADYLLVLAYAIAIQSFLNLLIDLGRKRIYQNNAWVSGARYFVVRVLALAIFLLVALIFAFPVLQYFGIIPASVSVYVWFILVLRGISGFIIIFSFTDSIQSGRISNAFPAILVSMAISLVFLYLLIVGIDSRTVAILTGIPLIGLSLLVIWAFNRRMMAAL